MGRDRYKYVVQVVLGVQKGQGIQAGCKNFWDADTDNVAFESYLDDNLFCLITVWGIYVYWQKISDSDKNPIINLFLNIQYLQNILNTI